MATVLVCDDSPLTRESLRRLLLTVQGVDRAVGVATGEELIRRYPSERPDLVFVDVRMPRLTGTETVRRLLALHKDAAVVMLTMAEDIEGVARAVGYGARGYLRKDANRRELEATVASVLTARGSGSARARSEAGDPPPLSERERQVLEGMSQGQSNAEIGRSLYLSEDTVKTHARRLFRKLDATDRAHAVALGFRWGIVR